MHNDCIGILCGWCMTGWNWNRSNYEINLKDGVFKSDGPEDHSRMMEALNALGANEFVRASVERAFSQPKIENQSQPVQVPAVEPQAKTIHLHLSDPIPGDMRLSEAMNLHLDEKISNVIERTFRDQKMVYEEFIACFENPFLNQINGEAILRYWRPREFKRKNKLDTSQKLSLKTLDKRKYYLSDFFEWARSGRIFHGENPMSQKIARKNQIAREAKPYERFTDEDLGRLFVPEYKGFMNKPDFYWGPLISLFSGARLGEIINLRLSDFVVSEGIPCYKIRIGKTDSSKRDVPIHSILINLGLWRYVEFLQSRGGDRLFWYRDGQDPGKRLSAVWGEWVDKCGIENNQKVFHSFRSTVITKLYDQDAPNPAAIRDGVGHSGGTKGSHGEYIRDMPVRRVQIEIEKISWAHLNFNDLKLDDPTFEAFYDATVKSKLRAKAREERIAMMVRRSAERRNQKNTNH